MQVRRGYLLLEGREHIPLCLALAARYKECSASAQANQTQDRRDSFGYLFQ